MTPHLHSLGDTTGSRTLTPPLGRGCQEEIGDLGYGCTKLLSTLLIYSKNYIL